MARPSSFRLPLLATALLAASCAPKPPAQPTPTPQAKPAAPAKPYLDQAFWSHWGDGQAEISTYDLTYPRYGSPRAGVAVAIFVTEPFSNEARVKADPGKHAPSDVFPVMKLNLVQDFPTGIYDYNEQSSSFLALASLPEQPGGHLAKVSFSSQEWCGHSWAQWLRKADGLHYSGHSYFDGEADRAAILAAPTGGIAEEQLWFWARGMAEPRLEPGGNVTLPFRRSLQHERHSHREAAWSRARFTREAKQTRVTVPAGTFSAETWRAEEQDGTTFTFLVEATAPHRILEWRSSEGERGVLIKSDRLKYWQMNKPGAEASLSRLGLRQRTPRTP